MGKKKLPPFCKVNIWGRLAVTQTGAPSLRDYSCDRVSSPHSGTWHSASETPDANVEEVGSRVMFAGEKPGPKAGVPWRLSQGSEGPATLQLLPREVTKEA